MRLQKESSQRRLKYPDCEDDDSMTHSDQQQNEIRVRLFRLAQYQSTFKRIMTGHDSNR